MSSAICAVDFVVIKIDTRKVWIVEGVVEKTQGTRGFVSIAGVLLMGSRDHFW